MRVGLYIVTGFGTEYNALARAQMEQWDLAMTILFDDRRRLTSRGSDPMARAEHLDALTDFAILLELQPLMHNSLNWCHSYQQHFLSRCNDG